MIRFPQYRRYKSGSSFFKITSIINFEEVRKIGDKWVIESYEARILPDYHLLNDLIYSYADFAEEISEEEYLEVRNKALGG
ncbi:MAG TPA: hypothetical protein VI731_02295 [Bacteroidia bacterium]|nr:hypothetical protein [Bacteroidia bacterium]